MSQRIGHEGRASMSKTAGHSHFSVQIFMDLGNCLGTFIPAFGRAEFGMQLKYNVKRTDPFRAIPFEDLEEVSKFHLRISRAGVHDHGGFKLGLPVKTCRGAFPVGGERRIAEGLCIVFHAIIEPLAAVSPRYITNCNQLADPVPGRWFWGGGWLFGGRWAWGSGF